MMQQKIILLLCLATSVFARESIKIAKNLDNNHFLTAAGDTISLAYVDCASLASNDFLIHHVADQTRIYLHDHVLNLKTFAEQDTLLPGKQIHLYRKIPLGYESINYLLLQKGYAYLVDAESAPLLYKQAAAEARRKSRGVYKKEKANYVAYYQDAVWINFGKGAGFIYVDSDIIGLPIIETETGITYRHNHVAVNLACDALGKVDQAQFYTTKLGVGIASLRAGGENMLLFGPTLYRMPKHSCENEQHDAMGKLTMGCYLRLQTLSYAFRSIGLGLTFTSTFYEMGAQYFVSVNCVLGRWMHPVK